MIKLFFLAMVTLGIHFQAFAGNAGGGLVGITPFELVSMFDQSRISEIDSELFVTLQDDDGLKAILVNDEVLNEETPNLLIENLEKTKILLTVEPQVIEMIKLDQNLEPKTKYQIEVDGVSKTFKQVEK